ncbi:UDP-glucuronosyltransferase 1A9 [Neodiprion fabricii]|uniref:UDP-glucuronosyltransferase 1A9 n=1 Tax=Neodiprion fabricii TaxID=2872261 RepID=UPI001ED8FBF5|nr:UDP-glucuronosyltransferase 1A9 [Neodiprion fabricii]
MKLTSLYGAWFSLAFVNLISASSLVTPPKSAVVLAFEYEHELSLLANTLSDENINTVLIIPSTSRDLLYDNLIDVEVVEVKVDAALASTKESRALKACESLLSDETIQNLIQEFSPTYVISPGLRHDACVLPWVRKFASIPVIWTQGSEAESYVFHQSGIALPILTGGFWNRLSSLLGIRSIVKNANSNYVTPALELVEKYLPAETDTIENLYRDVDLIFWGADTILRSDVSFVSQMLVEIGCHHCRGAHPVPPELQKELIERRSGTIATLLDKDYKNLIEEIARGLPQGRQGQAVVWKIKDVDYLKEEKPDNLFVNKEVIRQDIIGYPRTRVLLSHCEDTELLEAGFHGTPVICLPRDADETRNARRAIELGFSIETGGVHTSSNILSLIKTVHETAGFRENARKVSVAIRERPNPAVDRITYWLGYVARNKEEKKHLSVRENRGLSYKSIYSTDISLAVGFIVGLISGAVLPAAYILAGRILAAGGHSYGKQPTKPKRKYKT